MSLYWLMRAGRGRLSRDRIKQKDGVDEDGVAKSMKCSRRLEKTREFLKLNEESASVLLDGLNKMKLGMDLIRFNSSSRNLSWLL